MELALSQDDLPFALTWFDAAPRITGREPALGSPVAIMGFGVDPEVILPGAKLQARRAISR